MFRGLNKSAHLTWYETASKSSLSLLALVYCSSLLSILWYRQLDIYCGKGYLPETDIRIGSFSAKNLSDSQLQNRPKLPNEYS